MSDESSGKNKHLPSSDINTAKFYNILIEKLKMRYYENRIVFSKCNYMLSQLLGLISLYSIYIEELTKDFLEIKMISIEHAIYHAIASLPEVDSNMYHL